MTSIFTPRPTGLRLVDGAGPEAVPRTQPRDPLPGLWDFARMVWDEICLLGGEPAELATVGAMLRRERDVVADWLYNLELLVRRLLLIAALAFDPGPLRVYPPRVYPVGGPHERKTVLVWSDRPEGWPARFKMFPHRSWERRARKPPDPDRIRQPCPDTWPMARRIEALRRVLADPDKRARRIALRLARIRAANAKANEPRFIALKPWDFSPANRTTGKHAVNEGMKVAQPLAEDALDRWQAEPG